MSASTRILYAVLLAFLVIINVPLMITLTYGFGVALAAFAGVLAAPVFQVNPVMGSNLIIVVFAVVVIGGMGSIAGSIVTGLSLGLLEGLTKVFYPEASSVVIFVHYRDWETDRKSTRLNSSHRL